MKHDAPLTAETPEGEMRRLLDLQRGAARAGPPPDLALRKDRLDRLRRAVLAHEDDLVSAVDADFGHRPEMETRLYEVLPTLNAIRHARGHLRRWMRPERRGVDALAFPGARNRVRHEPLGAVGIVSPWNYPVLLALGPLVCALAAGNRALVKPSELTPRTSALLAEMLGGAFAEDEVAVIQGGVKTGRAFTAMPFDHLVFTGSTAVGREVAKAAAPNLTPVTLELGGKSPLVLGPDFDRAAAARSTVMGKFANAGQTCIAPDYALVPAGSERAFADAVLADAARAYPDPAGGGYARMITARHADRLRRAVAEAEGAGATVLRTAPDPGEGTVLPPMVVLGAPMDGTLMTEEIFGPVLPVIGYSDAAEALAIIAERERPLALYVLSGDAGFRRTILDGAISGGVTVNGTLMHIAQEDLPFGGVGPSGQGAYHGIDGFRRLSHARAVHHPRVRLAERLGPPWGRLARAVLAAARRR
ncbi:MAG: aldehyde dehydrogenase family protein [Hasllibacter sp.]